MSKSKFLSCLIFLITHCSFVLWNYVQDQNWQHVSIYYPLAIAVPFYRPEGLLNIILPDTWAINDFSAYLDLVYSSTFLGRGKTLLLILISTKFYFSLVF